MTTWRRQLEAEMKSNGDAFGSIDASSPPVGNWLDVEFNDGYGGEEGCAFTIWTKHRVYFPVCYDGSEWVGSVSRHPDGKPTVHKGGG